MNESWHTYQRVMSHAWMRAHTPQRNWQLVKSNLCDHLWKGESWPIYFFEKEIVNDIITYATQENPSHNHSSWEWQHIAIYLYTRHQSDNCAVYNFFFLYFKCDLLRARIYVYWSPHEWQLPLSLRRVTVPAAILYSRRILVTSMYMWR